MVAKKITWVLYFLKFIFILFMIRGLQTYSIHRNETKSNSGVYTQYHAFFRKLYAFSFLTQIVLFCGYQ